MAGGDYEIQQHEPAAAGRGYLPIKRVSWGAIFAGVFVALAVHAMLSLLGLSIGLATIEPTSQEQPFAGLGIGSAIWWVIASLISIYAGGWVAGRLAGAPNPFDGLVHGVVTWGLVTVITLMLVGTAIGGVISGAAGVVGRGLSAAGQGVAQVAPQVVGGGQLDVQQLINEIQQRTTPGGLVEIRDAAQEFVTSDMSDPANQQQMVNALAQNTDMTRAEAEEIVQGWVNAWQQLQQTGQQLAQTAAQVGEDVASGLAVASFWAFIGLLLGAIVGAFGGRQGTRQEVRA